MSEQLPDKLPELSIPQDQTLTGIFTSQTIFSGFWVRLGALLIDVLVIRIFFQLTSIPFSNAYYSMQEYGRLFGLAFFILYISLFDSKLLGGQTLGKKIFNIVTVDSKGEQISVGKSFLRSLAMLPFLYFREIFLLIISGKNLGFYPIATIAITFSIAYLISNIILVVLHPHKRGIHDIIADTFIVKTTNLERLNEIVSDPEQYEGKTRYAYRLCSAIFVIFFLFTGYQNLKDYKKEKAQTLVEAALADKIKTNFNLKNVSVVTGEYRDSDLATTTTLTKVSQKENAKPEPIKKGLIVRSYEWNKIDTEKLKKDPNTKKLTDAIKKFVIDNYTESSKLSMIDIQYLGKFDLLFYSKNDLYSDELEKAKQKAKQSNTQTQQNK